MSQEFNFAHPTVSQSDINLFLGPITPEDGPFLKISENWTLAHVMKEVGLFASIKQAKSNGWDKPIPSGYSEYTVSKRKIKVYILTPFD